MDQSRPTRPLAPGRSKAPPPVSRRSLVTPLIVAVLVSLATGLTLSTAGSTPAPVDPAVRSTTEVPVTGLLVGRGLDAEAAAELAESFPGWTLDVTSPRAAEPVVVVALRAEERRWRPYLLRRAAAALPARTTVVFQPLEEDRAAGVRRARRSADVLSGAPARRARR